MTTRDSEPGDALDQILAPGPRHSMTCDTFYPEDIYKTEHPPCSCGIGELWSNARVELAALRQRAEDAEQSLAAIRSVVDAQANDEGLWFIAGTASEGYLQQELRRLNAIVEANTDQARAALRAAIGDKA